MLTSGGKAYGHFYAFMDMPNIFPNDVGVAKTGDQLHIVSPLGKPVSADTNYSWGAKITNNTAAEYVFYKAPGIAASSVNELDAVFEGHWGYARANQLAVFKGTKVGFNGFVIEKTGEDFGVSAEYAANEITGRYAGTAGGTVTITLPAGFGGSGVTLDIDGTTIPLTPVLGRVTFSVNISQPDGTKEFTLR